MCCRYVSPEYASTGMLNEGSDVYSFGVLLMEIITGRSPIDYSRPPGEVRPLRSKHHVKPSFSHVPYIFKFSNLIYDDSRVLEGRPESFC